MRTEIAPPARQNLHPLEREYREKRKERKGVDNSSMKRDHAAHDPEREKKKGEA
jgi:hypothetical protein